MYFELKVSYTIECQNEDDHYYITNTIISDVQISKSLFTSQQIERKRLVINYFSDHFQSRHASKEVQAESYISIICLKRLKHVIKKCYSGVSTIC